MTEIKTEVERVQIGSIYHDEWSGSKVRFHDSRKDQQQIIRLGRLEKKIERNNWFIEEVVTPNDNYSAVWQENVNHLCSECEQQAMYDSDKHEFYCPRCSE